MVSNCIICIENQHYHQCEPLISHEVPTQPWYKVGMDLFSFKGRSYLVNVDYFSNFPELYHLSDTHSTSVIAKVKATFSRYGIPKYVVSDIGPQFSSFEFAQFAEDWDFIHDPSILKYLKSNGMTENAVKIMKGLLNKADKHKEDPYLALIAHRSTPSSSDNKSPYEKLLGHSMRTTIPDLCNTRKSKNIPAKFQHEKVKEHSSKVSTRESQRTFQQSFSQNIATSKGITTIVLQRNCQTFL